MARFGSHPPLYGYLGNVKGYEKQNDFKRLGSTLNLLYRFEAELIRSLMCR